MINTIESQKTPNKKYSAFVSIPLYLWSAIFFIAMFGLATPNPELTFLSIMAVPIIISLTWRKNEPPTLAFGLLFQWAAVTMKVFHANCYGITVDLLKDASMGAKFVDERIEQAIIMGLFGLIIIALGVRVGSSGKSLGELSRMKKETEVMSLKRIYIGYVISQLFVVVAKPIAWSIPSIRQFLFSLFDFKWVMFFILIYVSLVKKKGRKWIALVVLFEIFISLGDYFSEFKIPIFVCFLAFLTIGYRMTMQSTAMITILASVAVYFGIIWTAVKSDYRGYLSGYTGQQVVTVGWLDRYTSLWKLYTDLEDRDLQTGVDLLAKRISYVDMFAVVLRNVSLILPHTDGALSFGVIQHIFMPRILFPNKGEINDSEVTEKYIRVKISRGTSISIGYMSELYIDFGPVLMYPPLFFLGLFWGWLQKYFYNKSAIKLYGCGMGVGILLSACRFEGALAKMIAGNVYSLITMTLALKYLVPHWDKWFLIKKKKRYLFDDELKQLTIEAATRRTPSK